MGASDIRDRPVELWQALCEAAQGFASGRLAPKNGGSLLVAGCGLAGIDGLRDIEHEVADAQVVFYCLSSPIMRLWIRQRRPDALDLAALYDEDDRFYTYIQMSELIVASTRLGLATVAVFYGHPGVFCSPGHQAVRAANGEGLRARMRPGLSALDYLVADVGFDPAIPGLQMFEATRLVSGNHRIDPSLHVVLWQVGVVGEMSGGPKMARNSGFNALATVLCDVYEPDQPLHHYICNTAAGVPPRLEAFYVSDLFKAEFRAGLTSASTLYFPPRVGAPLDNRQEQRRQTAYALRTLKAPYDLAAASKPTSDLITPALRFFYALAVMPGLADQYAVEAGAVLQRPEFDTMSTDLKEVLTERSIPTLRDLFNRAK